MSDVYGGHKDASDDDLMQFFSAWPSEQRKRVSGLLSSCSKKGLAAGNLSCTCFGMLDVGRCCMNNEPSGMAFLRIYRG